MKKLQRYLIIGLIVLLAFLPIFTFSPNETNAETTSNATISVIGNEGTLVEETTVAFDEGASAEDLLIEVVGVENIEFQDFDWGKMLVGIHGVKPAEESKDYWGFYVNGVSAPVGASDYKVEENDNITFLYTNENTEVKSATLNVFTGEETNLMAYPTFSFIETPTAFDVLRIMLLGKEVSFEQYDFGKLVTSIDGFANDEDEQKYWMIYVNDEPLLSSIDTYQVGDGDIISFSYEHATAAEEEEGNSVNVTIEESALTDAITSVTEHITSNKVDDDWEALVLAKLGKEIPQSYIDKLTNSINESDGNIEKITDIERYALAILAVGHDPTSFEGINFIEKIYNGDVEKQGLNGVAYGLLALNSARFNVPDDAKWTNEKLINYLLQQQNPDGGWNWTGDEPSDIDTTAIVLTSLSSFKEDTEVGSAIEKGLSYLETTIKTNVIDNSSTASELIVALSSLGIDPQKDNRFTMDSGNLVTLLLTFQNQDGGFYFKQESGEPVESDAFSTVFAARALTAYQLLLNNDGLFYTFEWTAKDNGQSTDNLSTILIVVGVLIFVAIISMIAYRRSIGKRI